MPKPTLLIVFLYLALSASILVQDTTPVPDPVPLVETAGQDLIQVLLLGSDTINPQNSGRTDAILVVSINHNAGSVALLSIPRDLYVYIPGVGVNRINTAFAAGENAEAGRGPQLLKETIEYNLGLQVDRYARVDFADFKQIVDAIGGVDLPIDCAIQDWRLSEADMDPYEEDNWAMFTLPIGVQHMDGDLALWYVRSRRTSSDLDRGQRQQAFTRGVWQRTRQLGLLEQIRDIWPQLLDIVETDISLQDMLSLVPLALQMDESAVSSYTFALGREVRNWTDPGGASVLLPEPDAISNLLQDFVLPPTDNQLAQGRATIRIVDASGSEDLALVAASKLAWLGFVTTIDERPPTTQQLTTIIDHTGSSKGSRLSALQEALRVDDANVISSPEAERRYDYDVIIGWSFYACTRNVQPPTPEA